MKSGQGTYALILKADGLFEVTAGKLGLLKGRTGYYVYCGSAFGPGGIKARTAHHLRCSSKPHWHIDYLGTVAAVQEIWYSYDPNKREHDWTHALLSLRGFSVPFPGFGSSDCSCRSHLVFSPRKPSYHQFIRTVHRYFANHYRISRLIPEGLNRS